MDETAEQAVRARLAAERAAVADLSARIGDELVKELLVVPAARALGNVERILDLTPCTDEHAPLIAEALREAVARRHEAERLLAVYCSK